MVPRIAECSISTPAEQEERHLLDAVTARGALPQVFCVRIMAPHHLFRHPWTSSQHTCVNAYQACHDLVLVSDRVAIQLRSYGPAHGGSLCIYFEGGSCGSSAVSYDEWRGGQHAPVESEEASAVVTDWQHGDYGVETRICNLRLVLTSWGRSHSASMRIFDPRSEPRADSFCHCRTVSVESKLKKKSG